MAYNALETWKPHTTSSRQALFKNMYKRWAESHWAESEWYIGLNVTTECAIRNFGHWKLHVVSVALYVLS